MVAVAQGNLHRYDRGNTAGFPATCLSPTTATRRWSSPAPRSALSEEGTKLAIVPETITLKQLVDGLNALGIGPRDMISILQAIKAAGALQAEIEVL